MAQKYKVDDKVRIKNLDWYNENKNEDGVVELSTHVFTPGMSQFCGKVMTIEDVFKDIDDNVVYYMEKIVWDWTDEMIEGLVQDENNHLTENVVDIVRESNDRYRIVLDPRFDIEVDEGEYYAVRRKKEYPKTYEECLPVLEIYTVLPDVEIYNAKSSECKLFEAFIRLKRCRDAYWKIAGEEMGLGKPWAPDYKNENQKKYCIYNRCGDVAKGVLYSANSIFAFPTPEMRDSFKENFDSDIDFCKEFL